MKPPLLLFIVILINSLSGVWAQSKGKADGKSSITGPIESVPHYPGGQDSLASFLQKNLHWPEPEIDVQGKVIVSFIVTKSGRITNIKVIRPLYKSFDAEAIRVIKLMPAWIPAEVKGKPVNRNYHLPISFTLDSE
ncbi:energy transducer TonB [Mucilaginibacter angelicae]|uniref:Energy transducer TonB n=1 Tax=Mucilaginibacter angelicae TaxID=869718 RepID=A0ABV6LGG7_9SPHI